MRSFEIQEHDALILPAYASVPTAWWLWEFEGPFHSWLFMVIGMLTVALAEKMKFGRPNARP